MTMASVARLAKAKGKDYREREAAGQTTLFGGGASDADSGHRPRRRRPRGPGAEAERNHALRSQHHRKRAEDHQHRRTPGAPGAQEHAQAIMAHNNAADAHNAARTAHAEGRPGAEAAAERANDRTRDAEAASIRARSKETPRHTGRHGEEGGRGSGRIRDALDPGGRAPAPRDPVSDHQIGRRAAHHADAAAAHRAVAAGRPSDAKQHRAAADAHENASVLHAAGHADAGRASVEALAASDAVAGGRGATSSGDDARDRREGEARGRVAQAKAKLDAAKKKAGDKPPSGYYPAKRSKKGGFTDGKGNYWYPGKGAKPAGAHDGEHGKDAALAHHDERRAHHDEMALEHKKAAADPYRTMESRGKHADAERKHHHAAVHHGAAHADIRAGRVEPSDPKRHDTLAGTTSEWADDHDRAQWNDEDAHHHDEAARHRAKAAELGGHGPETRAHLNAADAHEEAHRHGRGSIDTRARDVFSERANKAGEKATAASKAARKKATSKPHTRHSFNEALKGRDRKGRAELWHEVLEGAGLTGSDQPNWNSLGSIETLRATLARREGWEEGRKKMAALDAELKKRGMLPLTDDEMMDREAARMDAEGVPHPRDALDAHTAYKKTKGALGTDLVEYLEMNAYKVPPGAHDLTSLTDKELRKLKGQVWNALNAPGHGHASVRTRRQARKAASALSAEADRRLNEGHKDKADRRKTGGFGSQAEVDAAFEGGDPMGLDPNAAASASMKQKPGAVKQAAAASVSARTEKDTPKPGSHAALVAAGKAALERADHPQHKVPKALLNRGGRLGRERGIKEAAESWYKHPGHSGMPARHEVIKQVQKDRQRWHEDGGGKGSSKVADLAPSYLHEYAKHAASQYGDTPQAAPDPQEHGLSGGEAADLVSRFTKLMGTPEEPTSWSGDHGGAQMPAEHGHGEDFHRRLMTEARTNAASSRSGIHNSAHLHRIVQQADQHVADFAESKSSHRSGGAVATYHPDEEQHWGTAMAALQNAHGDTHRFEAKRRKTDNQMVIRAHRKSGKSPKA